MVRLPREARRGAILELQRLIAGGESDRTAMRMVRDRFGISVATAHRWLSIAYADWNRARRRMSRDSSLGFAIAVRRRAMALALERKKHVVVGGRIEKVHDPDVRTYVAAADSEARLLGLLDNDAIDSARATAKSFVADVIRDLIAVISEEVPDISLRARLMSRFSEVIEGPGGASAARDVVVDAPT
jgi:hypothetical protein